MSRQTLTDASGTAICVDEGESCRIVVKFTDYDGSNILSASIASLECTLRDYDSGTVINGRDGQSVLNANGGTLADEGGVATLKLTLDAADNINVGGLVTGEETHTIDFEWSWNDGSGFQTGIGRYQFTVCVDDGGQLGCTAQWVG